MTPDTHLDDLRQIHKKLQGLLFEVNKMIRNRND